MEALHPTCRILVTGASGAGCTTLARALATALAAPVHDTDDYLFVPTMPPFRQYRPEAALQLMRELFLGRSEWVLSGGIDGWADEVAPLLDFVVFLRVPTELRLERLRARERRAFGPRALAPGGWRAQDFEQFLAWAAHYDDGAAYGRNFPRQRAWLATLSTRVMEVDGTREIEELVSQVLDVLPAKP